MIEFVMLAVRRWMSVPAPSAARSWRFYVRNWFLNARIVSRTELAANIQQRNRE